MLRLRVAVVLALVVRAVLFGSVALAHVHDTSAPGLYDRACSLCELSGHLIAAPSPTPSAAPGGLVALPLPVAPDVPAPDVARSPAAPRAPPLR